eukprot:gene670-79_t
MSFSIHSSPSGILGDSPDSSFVGTMGPPKSGVKLFAGRLPFDFSKEDVHLLFSAYGHVADIHMICHNSGDFKGDFKGCAMDPAGAQLAVDILHKQKVLSDKPMTVEYANSEPPVGSQNGYRLFVGGLPKIDFDEFDLEQMFSKYGKITDTKLFTSKLKKHKDEKTGGGFIVMANLEDAQHAIIDCDCKH